MEEQLKKEIIKSGLLAVSKLNIFSYYTNQDSRAEFCQRQIMHMVEGLNITWQLNLDELELELMKEGE